MGWNGVGWDGLVWVGSDGVGLDRVGWVVRCCAVWEINVRGAYDRLHPSPPRPPLPPPLTISMEFYRFHPPTAFSTDACGEGTQRFQGCPLIGQSAAWTRRECAAGKLASNRSPLF